MKTIKVPSIYYKAIKESDSIRFREFFYLLKWGNSLQLFSNEEELQGMLLFKALISEKDYFDYAVEYRMPTFSSSNNVLTISGNGEVIDYSELITNLNTVRENLSRIVTSDEVTAFGEPFCTEKQLSTDKAAVESAWIRKAIRKQKGFRTYSRSLIVTSTGDSIAKEVISKTAMQIADMANEARKSDWNPVLWNTLEYDDIKVNRPL